MVSAVVISRTNRGGKMLFHLDDSEDLEMRITHFEPNKTIGFTWDIGKE